MKHGDKNAKTAKAVGQASGKKGGSQDVREAVKTSKGSQAAGKGGEAGKETRKASDTSKKQQAGPKAGGAKTLPETGAKGGGKEAGPGLRPSGKAGPPVREGFSNDVIAGAFKRAVKKYPNAFRRLTD